jgi:transcriptional regulator with XRE-family HTH domain
MARKPKDSSAADLCAAVKRVRLALGEAQEAFSRRVGLSAMTVSKFELGKQVPRDRAVLAHLAKAARAAGLEAEAGLFEQHSKRGGARSRILVSKQEWTLFQETLDVLAKGIPLLVDATHEVPDAVKARIGETLLMRVAWFKGLIQPDAPEALELQWGLDSVPSPLATAEQRAVLQSPPETPKEKKLA